MKKKIFALTALCAFAFNAFGAVFAATTDTKKTVVKGQTNQLAAQLPASDAVMTVDVKRLFADAMPQILSGNQPMLSKIIADIDELKNKTGFDLRQFEQLAFGVATTKNAANGELDFQPVILARGAFNANALIAVGRTAAKGKYREEKVGDRSIFVFSPRQLLPTAPPPAAGSPKAQAKKTQSVFERAVDKMFDNLSREIAVTAFDDGTLAIGSQARVRQTLGASGRVGADVLSLINRRPNAVAAVGLKLPEGVSSLLPAGLDNDEIGKNLDAIRYLAAAFDTGDGTASVSIAAKTLAAEQAKSLQEQIEGLQSLGKMFIGGGKGADKQVFARMIDNLKIARAANEVTLDLQVSQADVNILLSKKK